MPTGAGDRRPAVLMVSTVARTVEHFLVPFGEHFAAKGWRVECAARGAPESAICCGSFEQSWEIPWSRHPGDIQNVRAAGAIRDLVATQRFDVVHVHTPVAAFVTRCALARRVAWGRPFVVYSAHGFHFHAGGRSVSNHAYRLLEKLASRWTDSLVVVNREDEAASRSMRLRAAGRSHFVPGFGVDVKGLRVASRNGPDVRRELGLSPADCLFLVVAEFIQRKRHADIMHALAALPREKVHLALAGDGPLREHVVRLAHQLGVADRVHLLGFRRDVPALLRRSNALLLASQQEGLPQCVMEALALGIPVIGADARGTRDLLEPGGGILFPVGNVPALAEVMEWVADHPKAAAEMGHRGIKSIGPLRLDQILLAHEEIYDQGLLARRGHPLVGQYAN
jgi:glycosyltransferase involved in cell wall biosynthesis